MFTGIVEELGIVVTPGARLALAAASVMEDSDPGASLAVNGVCLTVVERTGREGGGGGRLVFDLSPETLERSTLGNLKARDPVNLERPVTLLTRMGGHLVQGHVDGVGLVETVRPVEAGTEMRFLLPRGLGRYVVEKGSITVDGVSLTVTDVSGDEFGVALIPHTLEVTALGSRGPGDRVNVEVDMVAKYIEGFVGRSG